ncbi:unnamed protein product [Clavelina lepadiformis]|uniref:28S ribosomal protein S30, mitochondrial n=1 Tax=Clavelina lepadiformis TaxID=159417 RepID=A0ABP0GRN7_CLALP
MQLGLPSCARCSKMLQFEKVFFPNSVRSFSTSKAAYVKSVWRKTWPTFKERLAQQNLEEKRFPIPRKAQDKRLPWEYPKQADQKATFKHRRWYDVYYERWVDTYPRVKGKYCIGYKDKRQLLFDMETPNELFYFLLDRYPRKKYIINSFDEASPISNISYYYQYLTHTKYVHGMPYQIQNAKVDEEYMNDLRSFVNETLMMKYDVNFSEETDPLKKEQSIKEKCFATIMKYLATTLSTENNQLLDCEIDHNAENSLFWLNGRGFLKWTQPDDMAVPYQCHDKPFLQIRTKEPLPEFSPWLGEFSTTSQIPSFYTTPHVFKLEHKQYRNMISPGYKLFGGDVTQNYHSAMLEEELDQLPPPVYDPCPHGHTQLFLLPKQYSREWYRENAEHSDITGEIDEHLKGHGIMSGWVWTAAQAHYNFNWMDNDVTRPFCSQTIITDGQWLSFYCYQLNTIAVDADNLPNNDRRNICYGRTSMKLFDEITPEGVVGLNDNTLQLLVKFVANGKEQYESVVSTAEEVAKHDASLLVQESDPDVPEIELQKPTQKVSRDDQRRRDEEEAKRIEEKSKTFRERVMGYLK